MTRFEERQCERLKNEEFAAGFREMDAELTLLQAIDAMRESLDVTKEEMAKRMHRHRASLSRALNAQDANPTLETITEMLDAIGATADIELRPRVEPDDAKLTVKIRMPDAVAPVPVSSDSHEHRARA